MKSVVFIYMFFSGFLHSMEQGHSLCPVENLPGLVHDSSCFLSDERQELLDRQVADCLDELFESSCYFSFFDTLTDLAILALLFSPDFSEQLLSGDNKNIRYAGKEFFLGRKIALEAEFLGLISRGGTLRQALTSGDQAFFISRRKFLSDQLPALLSRCPFSVLRVLIARDQLARGLLCGLRQTVGGVYLADCESVEDKQNNRELQKMSARCFEPAVADSFEKSFGDKLSGLVEEQAEVVYEKPLEKKGRPCFFDCFFCR